MQNVWLSNDSNMLQKFTSYVVDKSVFWVVF